MTTSTEQLKALAEAVVNNDTYSSAALKEAFFQIFATPERILALIAENERLTQANIDLTTTLRLATKRRSEPDSGMEIMKL